MKTVTEFLKYIGIILIYLFVQIMGIFFALIIFLFKEASSLTGDITKEVLLEKLSEITTSQSYMSTSLCISSFIFIIGVIVIYKGAGPLENWKLKSNPLKYILFGFGFNFVIGIISSLVLSSQYIEQSNNSSKVLFEGNPVFVVVTTAFLVPLFEEIVFRYLLLNVKFPHAIIASKENVEISELFDDSRCFIFAAVIQAVLFGLFHGEPFQMCYTAFIGFIFALVNRKHGSLLPSFCMHCGLNLYAALSLCFPETSVAVVLLGLIGAVAMAISLVRRGEL